MNKDALHLYGSLSSLPQCNRIFLLFWLASEKLLSACLFLVQSTSYWIDIISSSNYWASKNANLCWLEAYHNLITCFNFCSGPEVSFIVYILTSFHFWAYFPSSMHIFKWFPVYVETRFCLSDKMPLTWLMFIDLAKKKKSL